jgi:hypothetical protein
VLQINIKSSYVITCLRPLEWNAFQIDMTHPRAPFLPPDRLKNNKSENYYYSDSIEGARSAFREIHASQVHKKKRMYLDGCLFENMFDGGYQILDSDAGLVNIDLGNGKWTKARWRTDEATHPAIKSIQAFCTENIKGLRTGNCRQTTNERGMMTVFGYNKVGPYVSNNRIKTPGDIGMTANMASDFFKATFPQVVDDICEQTRNERRIDEMSKCIVSRFVVSKDLVNSSHIDVNDASPCLSTWVEDVPETAKNWFFVLPFVSIDGERAIVIRLKHGRTIHWDGRQIQHCSTVGKHEVDSHCYGFFFGSSKK